MLKQVKNIVYIGCAFSKDGRTTSAVNKMNHQQLAVVAFLGVMSVCCGHIGGGQIPYQNTDTQVYCGRTLARALALLCFGEPADKRSEVGTMYNTVLSPYYKEQETEWPWLEPHRARSLGLPSRGKRYHGVVNECCDKACSINELLSYC